ncbi:hypothetical protein BBJ28_00025576 [Nothophytophthora sp. Chile5]|nr:hypothetical protein BBJ28_00025576 [Nothophytophthora sp. Chile5]
MIFNKFWNVCVISYIRRTIPLAQTMSRFNIKLENGWTGIRKEQKGSAESVEMQRRQRGYSESEESEDERPASRGGYSKAAKRGRPRKNLAAAPPPQKKRRRKSSWQDDDDEDDDDFQAAGGDSSGEKEQEKKKRRPGRPRKVPVEKAAVPKRRRQQAKEVPPLVEDGPADMMALEERHRTREADFVWGGNVGKQHELDSERLLREVRDLALAEKKTQERLVEKLKKDITTLSRQAEEERKKRTKEVDRLVEERMQKYVESVDLWLDVVSACEEGDEALMNFVLWRCYRFKLKQRDYSDADAEKAALRQHIKELEAQFASFKRSTGPDDIVTLLEIYRLVTSTDIRLIEAIDDDSQDPDDCTDVVCTTTDSAEGKRFEFELAVPANASSEIEYLPSEKPPTDLKVPSYLRVRCVMLLCWLVVGCSNRICYCCVMSPANCRRN